MQKFLFLIREDIDRLAQMSQQELHHDLAEMNSWVEELIKFDNFISGDPLESASKIIGNQVAADGLFIDSREGISGYLIIKAENMEQAAAIAAQCPHILHGTTSKKSTFLQRSYQSSRIKIHSQLLN